MPASLWLPELVDHLRRHDTGTLPTTSLEGIPLISTLAYAPSSQWAVAVGLPEATLQAPLYRQLRNLAILGAVLLATAFILAFLTARYLDTSIQGLRRAARRVGSGEVIDPPPTRVREVQHLADVLSQISHELHDRTTSLAELNATLEEQVAARTAQLSGVEHEAARGDETARGRPRSQLRQIQKLEAIGQLTGGIAHDFNNMLAVVMSSLRLIAPTAGARRHAGAGAHRWRPSERGTGGEPDAAGCWRSPASSPCLPKRSTSTGCLPTWRTCCGERCARTSSSRPGWRAACGATYVDVPGLENAIINLAANARDAMANGGKLTMETANTHLDEAYAAEHAEVSAGDYVMIAVTDTGCGMTPEVVQRAFDPFFTTKPPGQGTGLGLSQVFGFLKQSGGHVSIYSEVAAARRSSSICRGCSIRRIARRRTPHASRCTPSARKN